MATMNVSLPAPMKEWVESQTTDGHYSNASDYIRDLIRKDQEHRNAINRLQAQISEGLESGVGQRSMEEILRAARLRAGSRNDAV